MTTNAYKPTGYKVGRPRKGEVRPVTAHGEYNKEYYHKRKAADPFYLDMLAERSADWRANNLERSNEIGRKTNLRAKQWKTVSEPHVISHVNDAIDTVYETTTELD